MSCLRHRLPKATDVCFSHLRCCAFSHDLRERGSAVAWRGGSDFPRGPGSATPFVEKTVLALGSSVLLTSHTSCPWRRWSVSLSPKPTASVTELCEPCCLVAEPSSSASGLPGCSCSPCPYQVQSSPVRAHRRAAEPCGSAPVK